MDGFHPHQAAVMHAYALACAADEAHGTALIERFEAVEIAAAEYADQRTEVAAECFVEAVDAALADKPFHAIPTRIWEDVRVSADRARMELTDVPLLVPVAAACARLMAALDLETDVAAFEVALARRAA